MLNYICPASEPVGFYDKINPREAVSRGIKLSENAVWKLVQDVAIQVDIEYLKLEEPRDIGMLLILGPQIKELKTKEKSRARKDSSRILVAVNNFSSTSGWLQHNALGKWLAHR